MSDAIVKSTFQPFESQSEIGLVQPQGSAQFDPQQQIYTLTSAGANIWGEHDDFHFVRRRMQGVSIVTTRAAFIGSGSNPHRKLGWMARASLEADAPHTSSMVHGDGLVSLLYRRVAGGETEEVRAPIQGADVIQLERKGNTFVLSAAHFGEPFTPVQVSTA